MKAIVTIIDDNGRVIEANKLIVPTEIQYDDGYYNKYVFTWNVMLWKGIDNENFENG